ncbi:PEP-CTERM putative exosortase interaction domain-containing protein [Leptolyngbyaceae cyanobacterium JSC-12]|nr:PEP-CTERM putative exosortase interaction domain-containing protein [Leptolyngbyaceae cyanobacterium JSC-12]
MKFDQISAVLGVATAAAVSAVVMPAEQAAAATFQLVSGVTSVSLDLPTLESVGLRLTGATGTVPPVSSDFLVGFTITPATTFTFTTDGGFAPVSGTIEHTGSVTFNNALTVGNFSIGFDPARAVGAASGFFVRDTITTGAALFDVAAPSTLSFNESTLRLDLVSNLLVSRELAGVLGNTGLVGAKVGAASINGTAVPEPATMLGALIAGGFLAARRRLAKKNS